MTTTTPQQDPQAFLLGLYRTAVRRAQPLHSMAACLPPPPKGRTVVLGAGKAGASMVQFYTGMVYRGPELVHECVEAIRRRREHRSGGVVPPA